MAIVGIPAGIHIIFSIHTTNEFLTAKWTAGELLSYYGSVLTFAGTVSLGALSIYQTQKISQESDKRAQLLDQKEHDKELPKIVLKNNAANGNANKLRVALKNISENLATNIMVYNIHITDQNGEVMWSGDKKYSFDAIAGMREVQFGLENPAIRDGQKILIEYCYMDKFNYKHCIEAVGIMDTQKNKSFPTFSEREKEDTGQELKA